MSEEIFTAYDIRGKVEKGVSLEVAWNIGKAVADWLSAYGVVAVMRGEGAQEKLVAALIEGLQLQGRDVLDAATGSKQLLKEYIENDTLAGGIFVAHDAADNLCIIELYDDKGHLVVAENGLQDIALLVNAGNFVPAAAKGALTAIA